MNPAPSQPDLAPSSPVGVIGRDPLFSVAAAVEFARQRGGDCATLITYVALKETGMIDEYMKRQQAKPERAGCGQTLFYDDDDWVCGAITRPGQSLQFCNVCDPKYGIRYISADEAMVISSEND
jgi:hypothetical protein